MSRFLPMFQNIAGASIGVGVDRVLEIGHVRGGVLSGDVTSYERLTKDQAEK